MCWVVKMKHKSTGNTFYLSEIRMIDGVFRPFGCMKYRASFAALRFSNLCEALSIVRRCSPSVYNFLVRPEFKILKR